MELRIRSLVKGMLSFVIPNLRTAHHAVPESSVSAEYCYSVFLRHFSRLSQFTGGRLPTVVAELGPGSSIGTGLAAVIAGADRCIGLDVQNHTDAERNLRIFDDLVVLFRNRTPVLGKTSPIATHPLEWNFPQSLEHELERALTSRRLAAIRRDIADATGRFVTLIAPWNADAMMQPQSLDWIFSHSVMEHVEDVDRTYQCCADWLKDGGYMTHEIDYGSHGLTLHWNGHWTISRRSWKLMKGARPFLINRLSHQQHIDIMRRNGFSEFEVVVVTRQDGLGRKAFATPFEKMSSADSQTHIAFIASSLNRNR